jgi:hypothetical protein
MNAWLVNRQSFAATKRSPIAAQFALLANPMFA